MDALRKLQYKGHTISIYQDEDAESPREWDNLGVMVCFHKRYDLGDKAYRVKQRLAEEMFSSWDQLEGHLKAQINAVVVLPLYLYDHSGLRIKVGSFQGLLPQGHAEFDSGKVGFIYVSREAVRKKYDRVNKATICKAESVLRGEVEVYNQYLRGDVYGYVITDANGTELEGGACGGYYGSETAEDEARALIDTQLRLP